MKRYGILIAILLTVYRFTYSFSFAPTLALDEVAMAASTDIKPGSRLLLWTCSIGLLPIALSYGAAPADTMPYLFGFPVDTLNLTHIFRAVMGLYFGMVVLWIMGATNPRFTGPALLGCAVFMLGLAAGRVMSLVVDGIPHPLLLVYLLLELTFGALAVIAFNQTRSPERTF